MAEEEKKEQAAEEPETAAEQENTPEKEEAAKDTPAEKPEKEKKPKKSGKNPFRSKKFKHGSLSVVFTVIFVAAIVLVNVIFNLLLDRFDIKADLTEGGLYTAGAEIKEFTQYDKSKVHFYFTSAEETLESADKIYKQSVELVKQLVTANGGYDVTYVDMLKTPAFAEEHGITKEGCLLIECEDTGRSKSFDIFSDFKRYVMQDGNSYSASDAQMMMMYGYKYTDETSIAEQELLSALVSVTKLNPVKAALTSGFGESENKALTTLLEKNAYIVETLDVDLAAEIPADLDILIMNAPTMDYSDEALTKIDEWLSNGGLYGKSLVYFAAVSQPVSSPRLNAYLEEWGIRVGDSFILQMDANYAYAAGGYSNMPLYQRAEIATDTDYYKAMQLGENTSFRANGVRPVIKLWDERSIYKNTTIVRTCGDNCVLLPFDADNSWNAGSAEKGQFDIITEATKVRFDGNTPIYSRVVAAGSEMLFSEYFLTATNYNNAEAAIGIFNTISGNTDKQITVTPKSFTAKTYEIDSAQQTGIGLTFAVIIPVVIIILGIVVWVRRRHL